MPQVFLVVLNWNGWRDTVACVQSIKNSTYAGLQIIVVDNGSTDTSVEMLRESLPDLVIIETGRNLGFSGGNNRGITYALEHGADYIFVLNNDTTVKGDCIHELIRFGESNPEAALMGPRLFEMATEKPRDFPMLNKIGFWAILFTKSPISRLIKNTKLYRQILYSGEEPRRVYAVSGTAMMFRASTVRNVGMFDERTFIYWEEFIIAEKLLHAGLDTYVIPSAKVWHKGDSSISKIGAFKFIENIKSEKYFFDEYLQLSLFSKGIIKIVRFLGFCGRALIQKDYRKNFSNFLRVFF